MPEPVFPMNGFGDSGMSNMAVLDGAHHSEVKVKIVFHGQVVVFYTQRPVQLDGFLAQLRDACRLDSRKEFTVKWIDDEGDPCTVSSQRELDEAFRLYELNRDSELTIHLFLGYPPIPGMPCDGEDKHVYRRGARRWKKFYHVNGHKFQAKRFNRRAQCYLCHNSIWGLGWQGYRCQICRLAVHKRCHRKVKVPCGEVGYNDNKLEHYTTNFG